jgi:CHAT domain-containing protein
VFVNPSLVNWLAARRNTSPSSGALIATTCPPEQLAQFDEGGEIAAILTRAVSGEILQPSPEDTGLRSLSAQPPFQVLHLASHGMFDAESMEIGLLMSRDGQLPPPPPRGVDAGVWRYMVRPSDIYRQGRGAKLAFLASCVSSRNAAYPGDDLMGLTRAFFGCGTTDMIAGAWTVVSEYVAPFTQRFYNQLTDGQSVADAMLAARRQVSETHPSPFFWGAFQHQGANMNPLIPKGQSKEQKPCPGPS